MIRQVCRMVEWSLWQRYESCSTNKTNGNGVACFRPSNVRLVRYTRVKSQWLLVSIVKEETARVGMAQHQKRPCQVACHGVTALGEDKHEGL